MEDRIENLRALLFQSENIQHNRVYYLLVAETIFFVGAISAINDLGLLVILALAGLAVLFVFTIINLKNWFRILYLTEKLANVDKDYLHYIQFIDFQGSAKFKGATECVYCELTGHHPTTVENPGGFTIAPPRWNHTGFLFTWGLLWILLITWILIIICGAFRYFNPVT
jgi:hypothetical protein